MNLKCLTVRALVYYESKEEASSALLQESLGVKRAVFKNLWTNFVKNKKVSQIKMHIKK